MSILDHVRVCAALRDLGAELKISGGWLVGEWRDQVEALVKSGQMRSDAEGNAYREIVKRARGPVGRKAKR